MESSSAVTELQKKTENLKVALVHDWLVSQRGGENVLDAFCEILPHAHVYTLVHKKNSTAEHIERAVPRPSLLQKIPGIEKIYRYFLPLMPLVIESIDLSSYDLILSSSHCVAKGVQKKPGAKHVCYIHAPMRYMWDRFDEYFSKGRAAFHTRMVAKIFRPYLQWWDLKSAKGVDVFIANSRFIAEKVKQYYKRDAFVVHPFCEFEKFQKRKKPATEQGSPKPYFLIVTALVPYKRVDLAIEAFNRSGDALYIVGDGPDLEKLKAMAKSNIYFLGAAKNEELVDLYQKSKGLIFPGIEDFGIVPLEAMACGVPVLAYGEGGATETVIARETGLFFSEPTVDSLLKVLSRFQETPFQPEKCIQRASQFTRKQFQEKIAQRILDSIFHIS